MCSDVDKGTAALLMLVEEYAPCGNCTASQSNCTSIIDVTECACKSLLLQVLSTGILTVLVTDCELLAGSLCSLKHLESLCRVYCHGLLAHYVLACLKCVNGDEAVSSVRCADMNYIDSLVFEKLLIVLVNSSIRCAELRLGSLCSLNIKVAECNHLYVIQLLERRHMLSVCYTSASDDTDSHHIILTCHFISCLSAPPPTLTTEKCINMNMIAYSARFFKGYDNFFIPVSFSSNYPNRTPIFVQFDISVNLCFTLRTILSSPDEALSELQIGKNQRTI